MRKTNVIGLLWRGASMGIAEVIPGVSGGTIAFITGIYEKLLNSIKAIGPDLFTAFRKGGMKEAWKTLNGNFLLTLGIGMVLGIVIGVFGVSWLLSNYPPIVWAFFFGLIIASVIYIGKQIDKWSFKEIAALIVCAIFAYFLTTIVPAQGSESYFYVFFCGMIAISALILPGISGSFILLIMGMYTYIVQETLRGVLSTFESGKIITMMVFGLGCLVGLATISRLLSWTFKNYRNITFAALSGFMLGSLNKIWPWRKPIEWLRDGQGKIIMDEDGVTPKKILEEINISPSQYLSDLDLNHYLYLAIPALLLGIVLVFLLDRSNKNSAPDV